MSTEARATAEQDATAEHDEGVVQAMAQLIDMVCEAWAMSASEAFLSRQGFCGALMNSAATYVQTVFRRRGRLAVDLSRSRFAAVRRLEGVDTCFKEQSENLEKAERENAAVAGRAAADALLLEQREFEREAQRQAERIALQKSRQEDDDAALIAASIFSDKALSVAPWPHQLQSVTPN